MGRGAPASLRDCLTGWQAAEETTVAASPPLPPSPALPAAERAAAAKRNEIILFQVFPAGGQVRRRGPGSAFLTQKASRSSGRLL